MLLTDIFGKLHSNEVQFAGVQLDIILVNVSDIFPYGHIHFSNLRFQILRQEGPPADALDRLRVFQRDGVDYHLESEWHHWILLEGRKRLVSDRKGSEPSLLTCSQNLNPIFLVRCSTGSDIWS